MDKKNSLKRKLFYSLIIIILYLLGKNIPLPWVIPEQTGETAVGIQAFITSTLGDDRGAGSLFALGLMPFMTASIIFQLYQSTFHRENKRISPKSMKRYIMHLSLAIAILQAFLRSSDITYATYSFANEKILRILTIVVLVIGTMLTVLMAHRNKDHGIGNFSLLILVNILANAGPNIVKAVGDFSGRSSQVFYTALCCAAVATLLIIGLTVLFERAEIRIPVRRVMINNEFNDTDYLAIKMNPAGTMPVMYVMTLFFVPYYVLDFLVGYYPDNQVIAWLMANLNLNAVPGIILFSVLLILLTIALAMILVNPKDMAEDFQKNGDYIEGIRAGKPTRRYVTNQILFASIHSAALALVITVLPLCAKLVLNIESQIFMMPMTLMILTGITLNVYEEIRVQHMLEHYKSFI